GRNPPPPPSLSWRFWGGGSPGCPLLTKQGGSSLRLPKKDNPRRGLWLANCRRLDPSGQGLWDPASEYIYFCSKHFEENCFELVGFSGYHRLKEGAVPTIFESFSKLRRTSKAKAHGYHPSSPDLAQLRRRRRRYVSLQGPRGGTRVGQWETPGSRTSIALSFSLPICKLTTLGESLHLLFAGFLHSCSTGRAPPPPANGPTPADIPCFPGDELPTPEGPAAPGSLPALPPSPAPSGLVSPFSDLLEPLEPHGEEASCGTPPSPEREPSPSPSEARPVSPSAYMLRLPPPAGAYIQNEHSYQVGSALLWKRRAEAALDALDKAQRQLQACKRREQRLRLRIARLQQERAREKRSQADARQALKEHLQGLELQ
uniref:THAP domain containing 7 n=1 Tax=Sarcophilus harrisii TaxID=9305 RepID=A0A7N4NY42_SARHA